MTLDILALAGGRSEIQFNVNTFFGNSTGKEDQFEFKVPQDHDNNGKGDLTDTSNEKNIVHPSTIDQLLEELRKMEEDKNATNVAPALASYLMDGQVALQSNSSP